MANPYRDLTRYERTYVAQHLLSAGESKLLFELLVDLEFLVVRAEDKTVENLLELISEVLTKYTHHRETLSFLSEALRREKDFMAEHPHLVFQCVWNLGHLPGGSPGNSSSEFMEILETWRAQLPTDFVWCRSLRPPRLPLGHADRVVIRLERQHVTSLSLSADGESMLACLGREVCEWDTRSGKESWRYLAPHETFFTNSTYACNERVVAIGDSKGTIRLFPRGGGEAVKVFSTGEVGIASLISCDEKLIARTSNGEMLCWCTRQSTMLARFDTPTKDVSLGLTWLATVKGGIAVPDSSSVIRVWDVETRECVEVLTLQPGYPPRCGSSTHSLQSLAAVSCGDVYLWGFGDSPTSKRKFDAGEGEAIRSCALSVDGRELAYVQDHNVKRVNVETGEPVDTCSVLDGGVGLALMPNGIGIVAWGLDTIEICWPHSRGSTEPLDNPRVLVTALACSNDGNYVATGDVRRNVMIWGATNARRIHTLSHTAPVAHLAWSGCGNRIAAVGELYMQHEFWDSKYIPQTIEAETLTQNSEISVWQFGPNSEPATLSLPHTQVRAVTLSDQGDRLAIADNWNRIIIFDVVEDSSGSPELSQSLVIDVARHTTTALAFSPDGTLLACSFGYYAKFNDACVRVWYVGQDALELQLDAASIGGNENDASFGLLRHCLMEREFGCASLAFSRDNRFLLAGSAFEPAICWELPTGTVVRRSNNPTGLEAVSEPLRQYEVSVDGNVTNVYDAINGRKISAIPISAEIGVIAQVGLSGNTYAMYEQDHLHLFTVEGHFKPA